MDFTDQNVIDQVIAELPISNQMAVTRIISELRTTPAQEKTIYAVWTNTDLTEGRGREYVQYHCEAEATAQRLAKKNYVMGSDSRVTKERMFYLHGRWYAPSQNIIAPSQEDLQNEKRIQAERAAKMAKDRAIARAKDLGLTDAELAALKA